MFITTVCIAEAVGGEGWVGGQAIVPDDMWTKRIFNVISGGTQSLSHCQPCLSTQ